MSLFIFQGFPLCSSVRFAHRAASKAGPARERLQALKSVGGKDSNIYGDKRSLLRFLLGLQEGTPPFVPLPPSNPNLHRSSACRRLFPAGSDPLGQPLPQLGDLLLAKAQGAQIFRRAGAQIGMDGDLLAAEGPGEEGEEVVFGDQFIARVAVLDAVIVGDRSSWSRWAFPACSHECPQ